MGERDKGCIMVDAERWQRHIRPFGNHLHLRKTLHAGKGRARINDGDVIAQQLCDRGKRLADMHGAGDDKPRRRHMHGEEHLAACRLLHAALAAAQMFFEHVLERIARDLGALDQPLRAICDIGDDDRRAARGAFSVEVLEDVELHVVYSTFST